MAEKKCPYCGKTLKKTNVLGHEIFLKCECEVKAEEAERKETIQKGQKLIRERMREESGIKKRYIDCNLDRINARPGQEKALEKCIEFVNNLSKIGTEDIYGLLLCGGVGSGKTMFSAAIAGSIIDNWQISDEEAEGTCSSLYRGLIKKTKTPVLFYNTTELFEKIRRSYNDKEHDFSLEAIKNCKVLILDDMGAEKNTDWVNERLFEIVDHRYNEYLPIIVTTNITPKDLSQKIGIRSADRLKEMCCVIGILTESQRGAQKT